MSTPIILLDRLQEFVEESTKDILLPTKPTPKTKSVLRPPEVWKMRLPDRESETAKIPYIILQYLNGADPQDEGQKAWSWSNIRVIVGVYGEDESEGALNVLNVLSRLRGDLLKAGVVGEQFILQRPLEHLVIPDSDTAPFFFGEMMTTWQIPTIKREVPELWQGKQNQPGISQVRLNRTITPSS